jgi:transcriptional regulator with XRE-family HTH domain
MRDTTRGHGALTDDIVWSPRLGARLEASRVSAGKRRLDLAGQLGVSEETIRLWEKGAVQPSAERLARLIAVLSLETSEWSAPDASSSTTVELPPLAQRLRTERLGRGLTQAAVVALLGVPQATYAGWETGRSTPGTHLYGTLAGFLGIAEQDVATLCASPFVVDTAGWPPFGRFVGARRQELRLSRAALAEALGVSPGTVVSWELGYRVPATTQLTRLAAALSVDTASLAAALPRRGASSTLGELILARQRELGLRSADLARLTGTTEATVSRWVHGRSQPVPSNLVRLADALRMPYTHVAAAAGGLA